MAKTSSSSGIIQLKPLENAVAEVWIIGTAPVIMHKWSEKALRSMPGNPLATTEDRMKKKGVRDPEEEASACLYQFPDGRLGFPSTGFKAAIVGACRFFDKPSMVEAKLLIYVDGEVVGADKLVPIFTSEVPYLRTDAPRLANGSTDLRYRYQLYPWWAKLTVQYVSTSISASSIAALVDAAGRCGIGDWRPSSPKSATGTYGTFKIATEEEKVTYGITE